MTALRLQRAQLVAPLTPAENATRLSVSKPEPRRKPRIVMNTGPESYDVRPHLTPNRAVKSTSDTAASQEGIYVSSSAWESILGVVLIFGSFFALLCAKWWVPKLILGGLPW